MSLERKSVHVRLSVEQHAQLALLSSLTGKDLAGLAGELLEKMIVAEFHSIKRSARQLEALGMIRDFKG